MRIRLPLTEQGAHPVRNVHVVHRIQKPRLHDRFRIAESGGASAVQQERLRAVRLCKRQIVYDGDDSPAGRFEPLGNQGEQLLLRRVCQRRQ